MPAYNFKWQFAEQVKTGRKRQTIRPKRKRPTRVGDTLYLYAGQRTKRCELLMTDKCIAVTPIDIFATYILLGGKVLNTDEVWQLAKADGFEKLGHFYDFFQGQYGLPLVNKMELIVW